MCVSYTQACITYSNTKLIVQTFWRPPSTHSSFDWKSSSVFFFPLNLSVTTASCGSFWFRIFLSLPPCFVQLKSHCFLCHHWPTAASQVDWKSLGRNFINILRTAFTRVDPECTKKTVKSAVSFGAFGTYECKSCTLVKLTLGRVTNQLLPWLAMLWVVWTTNWA